MITIRYAIRTFIKNDTNKVAVRVRWNANKCETTFITGMYAEHSKWDADAQKAKRGTVHNIRKMMFQASDINAITASFREEIDNAFATFAMKNCVPTTQELKDMVNKALDRGQAVEEVKPVKLPSFRKLFATFISEVGKERNWDYKCIEKYTQAYTHLTSANPKITANTINLDAMFRLREWYVENQYKNRTINKQLIMLKTFLKWINQHKEYNIPDEVLHFNTNFKVPKKKVTFLYFDELTKFANYQFAENQTRLARARDLWCFMAYTSLRYSDLANLKTGHIVGDHIEMITQKTTDQILIPITDAARAILNRYKGKETADGYVFDVPSNQKLNDAVKEAAQEVGLDRIVVNTYFIGTERKEEQHKFYEIISCHDARRTFVSCSLAMGISAETVMKCTGHSSYNTMKPYIDTIYESQSQEMEKWNRSQFRSQIMSCMDKMSEKQLQSLLKEAEKLTSA